MTKALRHPVSPAGLYRAVRDALRRKSHVEMPPPTCSLLGLEYERYGSLCLATLLLSGALVFAYNSGAFGTKTNAEISKKYETLFTPAGWAFAIWSVIYASELAATGFMVFAQPSALLATASPPFVLTHVLQAVWTVAFERELTSLSAVVLTGVAASTVCCMRILAGAVDLERHLVLVPLSLHAGWTVAAALLSWNVAVRALDCPLSAQLALAFASVYASVGAAVAAFVVPLDGQGSLAPGAFFAAVAWALFAIGAEAERRTEVWWPIREAMRYSAWAAAAVVGALFCVRQAEGYLRCTGLGEALCPAGTGGPEDA